MFDMFAKLISIISLIIIVIELQIIGLFKFCIKPMEV